MPLFWLAETHRGPLVQRGAIKALVALAGVRNSDVCQLAVTALVGLAETHADSLVAEGAVQALLGVLKFGNLETQVLAALPHIHPARERMNLMERPAFKQTT